MKTSTAGISSTIINRDSKLYTKSAGQKVTPPVPGSMRVDGEAPIYGFLPSKKVLAGALASGNGDDFEQYLSDIATIYEVPFLICS